MSKLLINESPLQVLPSLAAEIGLNEAIVLQQVHYWTQPRGQWEPQEYDGHRWVYNSYPRWQEQFPFWSKSTIRRVIKSLEERGLLVSAQPRAEEGDVTKWYRIDYDALRKIEERIASVQDEQTPADQDEQGGVSRMNRGSVQDEQVRANNKERARDRDYTETTAERDAPDAAPSETTATASRDAPDWAPTLDEAHDVARKLSIPDTVAEEWWLYRTENDWQKCNAQWEYNLKRWWLREKRKDPDAARDAQTAQRKKHMDTSFH